MKRTYRTVMEFTSSSDNATPTKALIRKGKRTLQQAFDSGKLSEEDLAYIKCATDPYHDHTIRGCTGIPDDYVGKSITEVFTLTQDISTPYAAGSGNWGCRIYNNPLLGYGQVVKSIMLGNTFNQEVPAGVAPYNYASLSTLNVDYVSGSGNFQDYPTNSDFEGLAQDALNGEIKVIGLGIEVINTTAELNKQGMFTAARIPQTGSNTVISGKVYGNGGGGTAGSFASMDLIPVCSMPTTLRELTTYPNYTQWEAKEGAYAVIKQYDVDSFSPSGFKGVLRYIDYTANGTASGAQWQATNCNTSKVVWGTAAGTGMPVASYIQNEGFINAPMDSVCMMFTGLSEATTLTLRCKIFVERRVNSSIVNLVSLVPLAKESPPFNPIALELVSQIWSNLPVAVMFKENPAGEWWDKVMGAIGEYGPSLLGMIPHPAAQVASKALPSLTNALKTGHSQSNKSEVDELKMEVERLKQYINQHGQLPFDKMPKRPIQARPKTLKAKPQLQAKKRNVR